MEKAADVGPFTSSAKRKQIAVQKIDPVRVVDMPVQVTEHEARVTLATDIDALRAAVNKATCAIDQKYKKEA